MESLTCNETLVLQLPEEHSDFVQVQQGGLGVLQHGPLLLLSGRRKKIKFRGHTRGVLLVVTHYTWVQQDRRRR